MKKIIVVALLLVSVGCSTTGGGSGGIRFPNYSDKTLKNGLKVIVVEDHSLPYFTVGLLVQAGASVDPVGKSGLTDLTVQLLERGSKKRTATELADAYGNLGTGFSADADYDFTYLSTSGLTQDQNELLSLFFETVTEPSFSEAEVGRIKSETLAYIKRSYDEPRVVAGNIFNQMLYGAHPYGRSTIGSVRDVQSIKQKDIIKNYLQYFRPNNSTLVLVGDIKSDTLDTIEKLVANWQARKIDAEKMPPLKTLNPSQILLATRPDLKQSEIRMGHYGVKRNIEDYQVLTVADTILSEGFSSRLLNEIREKRGLTYGISSDFDARREPGPFTIYTNTRNEKVGEIIQETYKVFKDFYAKGVTEREVSDAKGYLRGAFPRRVETPAQMAQMLVALRFYGVDDDYMTDYIKNLNAITADDVNRVIKKYYHPDQLQILIYGPREPVIEQVRPIGTVQVKDYRELL